jgi:hypothetical protein
MVSFTPLVVDLAFHQRLKVGALQLTLGEGTQKGSLRLAAND